MSDDNFARHFQRDLNSARLARELFWDSKLILPHKGAMWMPHGMLFTGGG